MQNYKELLERFEQEVLNGMTNSASHQARVIFVEWLEKQAVEQLRAADGAGMPPEFHQKNICGCWHCVKWREERPAANA